MKTLTIIGIAICLAITGMAQTIEPVDALMFDSRYARATEWIDSVLQKGVDDDTGVRLLARKADALVRLGRFADAEDALASARPSIKTGIHKAIIETGFGISQLNQGLYDEALKTLQLSLQIFEQEKLENSIDASMTLSQMGNLYRAMGNFTQAEELLLRALDVREKWLPQNSEWIAASFNDLGLVYSQIDNDEALQYYERALKIYQALHGNGHPKIAIASTNIGFIYSKLELYGDATNNFESALKTWQKIYEQPHPTKAFLLYSLGETCAKIHLTAAARKYYQQALTMYQATYGNKHPELAVVFNALGNLNLSDNHYDDALDDFQRAMMANVRDFQSTDIQENPPPTGYFNGRTLLNSLLYKGHALEAKHFGKSLRFSDLKLALKTLSLADSLIDQIRQQIIDEADKISLGAAASDVYASGVRIAHETAAVASHKRGWLAQAFYFAEKSKSAVLLEAILESNARSYANIPEDLLVEEKKIKAAIALRLQQLAERPDDREDQDLRQELFSLNRIKASFTNKLERDYPQYFNLKYNTVSPDIDQLQSRLRDGSAIISYFIDDQNNLLYQFVISKEQFRVHTAVIDATFDKQITGLKNSLYLNAEDTYKSAALSLSKVLIPKKMPRGISDLIIIPTGRLGLVPFETLLTKKLKDDDDDFTTLPYLLKKYSIRYEFAASLILQKSVAPAQRSSILLCAPVTFAPRHNLPALPGTEAEVMEISRLFSARQLKSELILENTASEQLVKSGRLKSFSIVHFATHGVVDAQRPELSRIFLKSSDAHEDGSLYTGEIYNLELKADLVTLSACKTGLGKITRGEGVIGLSRSLVYAGARNVIVSFWSVADVSTAILMQNFYRFMLEHQQNDFGQNLRRAKLELITQPQYNSPYYWAPFVLIGF